MTEDINSKLLTTLLSPQPGNALQEVLAEFGEKNPKMKPIINYLAHQQANNPDDERDVIETETDVPVKKKKRSFSHLRKIVNNMYMELEYLREKNDTLAAALGACYLCWGEDPECPECNGKGQPGYFVPEGNLFTVFVTPALRKFQQQKQRNPGHEPREQNAPSPVAPHINVSNQKINPNKGEKNE